MAPERDMAPEEILAGVKDAVAVGRYEYSLHAIERRRQQRIRREEIEEAVASSELLEAYPDDKYWPSCLLHGVTSKGRHLHVQCTYPDRPLVKIITVYEPEPAEWVDFRHRRRR